MISSKTISETAIPDTVPSRGEALTLSPRPNGAVGLPRARRGEGAGGRGGRATNSLTRIAMATLAGAAMLTQVHAQDIPTLLKNADRYRMSADNLQVDTQVTVFNTDGSQDKERRYTVFAQTERKSLVLMQSPMEKGQKVLMLGDDFWLLMPGSQRPLRITPIPEAARRRLHRGHRHPQLGGTTTASCVGEESLQRTRAATARPCLHLSLQATARA
jgi:hypothetical protein